ncbi:MAG: hypothetical protein WC100_21375, partial [Sterolibacterium sp.]
NVRLESVCGVQCSPVQGLENNKRGDRECRDLVHATGVSATTVLFLARGIATEHHIAETDLPALRTMSVLCHE